MAPRKKKGQNKASNDANDISDDDLFKELYNPEYGNICIEFGDSEEFLVDGDDLLLHLLEEVLNESVLSSLHAIFRIETFLNQFLQRCGNFSLVFFGSKLGKYSSKTLVLLRASVIHHFKNLTKIDVLLDFWSPFDETFHNRP